MSFDDLAEHGKKKVGERRAFWERSKRLGHGTLVSLWREVDGAPVVTFAVVADRDAKELAGTRRPAVGLK